MGEASPTVILTDEEVDQQLAFVQKKIRAQEKKTDAQRKDYQAGFAQWVEKARASSAARSVALPQEAGHYSLDKPVDNKFRNEANRKLPANMVVSQQDQEPQIVEGKIGQALKLVGDSYVDLGNGLWPL